MNRIILQVVLVVASVALFMVYTDPLFTNESGQTTDWGIKKLKAEIAKYDDAINKSEELVAEKTRLVGIRDNIDQTSMTRLERLLPDSIDNIRLIIDINNTAKPFGLVLKGIRLAGNEKGSKTGSQSTPAVDSGIAIGGNDTIGSVAVQFNVTARYPVFKQFMHDLENSLRLADVTSFTVHSNEKDFYDYSVSLKTYWLR